MLIKLFKTSKKFYYFEKIILIYKIKKEKMITPGKSRLNKVRNKFNLS